MKTLNYILLLAIFAVLFSCNNAEKQNEIPVIDVTKSYPKKDIVLQDIADVEYIPLETRDDVLVDESRSVVYCSNDTIIINNRRRGDFLFFNGMGEFLSKFNSKGQSGQEYTYGFRAMFDKQRKELFVSDTYGEEQERLLIYDTKGVYKRVLLTELKEIGAFVDYDSDNILIYEPFGYFASKEEKKNLTPFMLLSKETGKLDTLKQIKLKDRVSYIISKTMGKYTMSVGFSGRHIIPLSKDLFVLNDHYSDTIFSFSNQQKLSPICLKTPSIEAQEKTKTLTNITNASERWLFVELQIKDFNFDTREAPNPIHLLIDKATNTINEYQLKNNDIADPYFEVFPKTVLLNTESLKELLEEGKLSGKLKEIAEKLDEEDNPVLVKVKFKE